MPRPKLGTNVPLPVIRPVSALTEVVALILLKGRSIVSARIRGDKDISPAAGKVKRYKAVWFVVVMSALVILSFDRALGLLPTYWIPVESLIEK